MIDLIGKVFGDSNEKALKLLRPQVGEINELEPSFERLNNEELRAKAEEFQQRLEEGETLNEILPETFAAVREASKRTLGQRHFDVQLMGGIVLHQGKISEMKTGEGKTLVATLPAYLNALEGKGVHVVTVNDYLARRDTQWMGPIYHLLGVSVACLQHDTSYLYDPTFPQQDPSLKDLRPVSRREAYEAHITYGTNHEFGFDYLRDNMVVDLSQGVQRGLSYAIVDEVDNILVDEARTPLIISGQADEPVEIYSSMARVAPQLREGEDYKVDEKLRVVSLTEHGIEKVERILRIPDLYDPENYHLTHYVENALRAHIIYQRDRDYVVKDGQVIIVDEFTGRLMVGRRWSEGTHQAVEAKEGVRIQRESVSLATITLQNYFRMYKKLAGMTGTAVTEAEEFDKIYKLDVVVVPTHKPMIRQELADRIYKSEKAKWQAVVREIQGLHEQGRPVLVGTVSIEQSEKLSALLQQGKVPHQVLNAKFHEQEAMIIAQAGRSRAVTVATNMAGRGTDIILGGNPQLVEEEQFRERGLEPEGAPSELVERAKEEARRRWQEDHDFVVSLGGLHILGTERHEARRIDNQLRGRSGRQGDPGSSRFSTSLEDDLMRRFGGDLMRKFMDWAGIEEEVPIENPMVTKAVANSQVKVEGHNFDIRKHLLDYDDVINKHREVTYAERQKILSGADLKGNVLNIVQAELRQLVATHLQDENGDTWDLETLVGSLRSILPLPGDFTPENLEKMSRTEVEETLRQQAVSHYEAREQELSAENMRLLERLVMLRTIDTHWIQHLTGAENLRQSIGLEAYGQRDPLVTYKRKGHELYQDFQQKVQENIARTIFHVTLGQPASDESPRRAPAGVPQSPMALQAAAAKAAGGGAREPVKVGAKVGRNDPCPCGSGKKYKKCHGAGG